MSNMAGNLRRIFGAAKPDAMNILCARDGTKKIVEISIVAIIDFTFVIW